MTVDKLTEKKRLLDGYRPLPPVLVHNLEDWFRVELTYTSNAIEGNALTRRETALVVEKGLTVGGKSLAEHLEATNHAHALDWVKVQVQRVHGSLSVQDILYIHELILKGIRDQHAGHYRNEALSQNAPCGVSTRQKNPHLRSVNSGFLGSRSLPDTFCDSANVPVRISGSTVILPNPRKVSDLMDDFLKWLRVSDGMHPVVFAAEAHYQLVTIHPFVDGNGRTARLLMNLILLMMGYPPAIIRTRDRLAYIGALETAQLGGAKDAYLTVIMKAVDRSLDIYLKALQEETYDSDPETPLLKIGALAKRVGESNATIRHWTKEGLLDVSEITAAGYQLYHVAMVERVQEIHDLKAKRLNLQEIKAVLHQKDAL